MSRTRHPRKRGSHSAVSYTLGQPYCRSDRARCAHLRDCHEGEREYHETRGLWADRLDYVVADVAHLNLAREDQRKRGRLAADRRGGSIHRDRVSRLLHSWMNAKVMLIVTAGGGGGGSR